jgi:hypothetical protein
MRPGPRGSLPMNLLWRCLCCMLLATLPAGAANVSAPSNPLDTGSIHSSSDQRISFPLPAPGDTLALPHRLIGLQHFSIRQGEKIYRHGGDYLLETVPGLIIWQAPRPLGSEPLTVTYRYLPLAIRGQWRREVVTTRSDSDTLQIIPTQLRPSRDLPAGADLKVGGSKTFSLEFGSRQDVNLSQSLDLTIRGKLSKDITVQAILTDRNLPLQPEGTTSELADLDQVMINVSSPWGQMQLGDMAVNEHRFDLLAHQRELEGLALTVGRDVSAPDATKPGRDRFLDKNRGKAILGRGVGRHRSLEFNGERGKQGPYKLINPLPGEELLMVAGSERIWVDNKRLSRGEDADYTVDYSRGELWFTSRQPISEVSEIRADLQIREGAYERNYYQMSAGHNGSAADVAFAWLREADDTENSPTFDLTDDERDALSAAGDSTTSALEGGINFLGPASGPYELVEVDTLITPIFVYVGKNPDTDLFLGSYEVAFGYVGEDKGDYSDSLLTTGKKIYTFIGTRRGEYLPGRRLQLPESLDMFALTGNLDFAGGFSLTGEGAISIHDGNTLSNQDDEDNGGSAVKVGGQWRSGNRFGGIKNRIETRFAYQMIEDRFVSPEPLDGAFYSKRWNSTAAALSAGNRRGTAGLTVRPGRQWQVDGDWETIDTDADFSGSRWHGRLARSGAVHGSVDGWLGRTTASGVDGEEKRGRIQLGMRRRWQLQTNYDFEVLRRGEGANDTGDGYQQAQLEWQSAELVSWLQARLDARLRWNDDYEGGSRERRDSQERYQAELNLNRSAALGHLIYAHTTTRDRDGEVLTKSDLADWNFSYKRPKRIFFTEWQGKLTVEEAALRSEKLLFVGPEAGHYDSLGMYIGIGDYELYYAVSDSSDLETRMESAFRVGGKPFQRFTEKESVLRGISASLYGKTAVGTPGGAGQLLSDPALMFRGAAPANDFSGLLRWEMSWKGKPRWPSPRLRVDQRRTVQRSFTGFTRQRRSHRENLDLRWSGRKNLQTRLELEQSKETESVGYETNIQTGQEERLERQRLALEGRWRFYGPLTMRLGGETGSNQLRPTGTDQTYYEALVGGSADLSRQGRMELVWQRRWSDVGGGNAGTFSLARPGWKLTLTGSLRPWGGLTTSISLRIDEREGEKQIITGRMDARAFF